MNREPPADFRTFAEQARDAMVAHHIKRLGEIDAELNSMFIDLGQPDELAEAIDKVSDALAAIVAADEQRYDHAA